MRHASVMMLVMTGKRDIMQESIAEVARRAGTDPRTVRAFLAGKPVRPTMRARVARAIQESAGVVESRSFVPGVRA